MLASHVACRQAGRHAAAKHLLLADASIIQQLAPLAWLLADLRSTAALAASLQKPRVMAGTAACRTRALPAPAWQHTQIDARLVACAMPTVGSGTGQVVHSALLQSPTRHEKCAPAQQFIPLPPTARTHHQVACQRAGARLQAQRLLVHCQKGVDCRHIDAKRQAVEHHRLHAQQIARLHMRARGGRRGGVGGQRCGQHGGFATR